MEFGAATTTLTKKLSNGYGVSGRSAYDGVFAAPIKLRAPSFSSQFDDYREIFGSSSASLGSSIPILELPEVNERKAMDDVRRSKLDYSKVFGGFGNLAAAVPFEELVAAPKQNDCFTNGASARSKVKGEHQSCQEDRPNYSKEIPVVSQSSEGAKRINMSYHKVNQGSENGANGTTHIAQIHAVSAYTRLIEEVNPVKLNRANKPIPVVQDTNSGNLRNEGIKEGGHCTRSFTGAPPNNGKKQSSNNGVKIKNRSNSVDLFFDACEISSGSNGTQHVDVRPSETMTCNLDNHNSDAMRSMPIKCQTSKSGTSQSAAGAHSPSYFDDMVDSNSEAAASVAALRKAIEEAQVRMKVAKESLRRKKEGFPDRVKQKSNIDLKAEGKKEGKLAYKTMKIEEIKVRQTFREMDAFPEVSYEVGKPTMRMEQGRSDLGAKEMCPAEVAVQEEQRKLKSTLAECKEEVEQKADHKGKVLEFEAIENNKKSLYSKNTSKKASDKPEESNHTIEVIKENWEQENNEVEVRADNEAGACDVVHETKHNCQEVVDETKMVQETLDNGTMYKRLKLKFNEDGEFQDMMSPIHEPEDYESNLSRQGLGAGDERKVSCDPEEDCKKVEGSFQLEECENKLSAIEELEEVKKNIAQEQKVGSEDEFEVSSSELEECELTEFLKPMKNETTCSQHGSDLLLSLESGVENLGCLEDRKRRGESGFLDIHQETEHTCQNETADHTFSNISMQEILEDVLDHIHDEEEIYERITIDSGLDGNGRVQDAQASESELEGVCHVMVENEREGADSREPVDIIGVTQTDPNYEETKATELGKTTETSSSYEPDETQKLSKTQVAGTIIENDETLEVTPEDFSCDAHGDIMVASIDSFQHHEKNEERESVQETNNFCEEHADQTSAFTEGADELNEAVNETQNTFETVTFEGAATNIGEPEIKIRQNQEKCFEKEDDLNLTMLVEEATPESVETCMDSKEARVELNEEIDENRSNSSNEEILFDNEHDIEASQIPSTSEWKQSSFKEEVVESIHSNLKESHQASMTMEEKEADDNLRKVKLELRKKLEAKVRDREREKEKLAVERAIREARERAFADARERAALGRAAAEARQKNASDRQERLGKTTSQANEKTPAAKAALEAKMKAERAAVERATAEARARALERALSEKAASEARNKSDKSLAQKLFGYSRDNGMKQNFHSKSFNHGVRDPNDVFGANCDSAQRSKARSERHQRIGERVAKALAEKSMRDRLVQKEQEERNRVAEVLDADVKRWSSGKAGNLRALLSTLQYILGPDSGWQPIPLTDIVTTTAVKKAYRKATLFVHPDKLQQRRASIQQKYICEKVFDLLKEAWNRFNMEER